MNIRGNLDSLLKHIFIYGLLLFAACDGCPSYYQKHVTNKEINGILIDKYIDKSYKNNPRYIFLVKNKQLIISDYILDTLSMWKCISIGDSVSKPAGTADFTIFKKNGIDTLMCRFHCDYWPETLYTINITDKDNVKYWCIEFSCTESELIHCVENVGVYAIDVSKCLGK